MGFLISGDWVAGEARALKVHVTRAQVRRNFDKTREQQFHKHGEFRAFLKKTKQTVPDLLLRTKLDLLSARIQRSVLAHQHTQVGRRHALERFIAHFKNSWTARTYCTPRYDVKDCGHVRGNL
jgi:hypothetical protein